MKLLLNPGTCHALLGKTDEDYLHQQDRAELRLLFLAGGVTGWDVLLLLSFLIKQMVVASHKGHGSDYSQGWMCVF